MQQQCNNCGRSLTNYVEHNVEDRVSALTTRDPNKLAVYLQGYDGHCLRAYYYFKDKMDKIQLPSEEEKENFKYFKVFNKKTEEVEYVYQ